MKLVLSFLLGLSLSDETMEKFATLVVMKTRDADAKSSESGKRSNTGSWSSFGGTNRNSEAQQKMSTEVLERDGKCRLSGEVNGLQACHIVGLSFIGKHFHKKQHYKSEMALAMTGVYHVPYDRGEWIFETDGKVVQLWDKCTLDLPETIDVSGLNVTAIRVHNEMEREFAKHRCPDCWKYIPLLQDVGDHRKTSCKKRPPEPTTPCPHCGYACPADIYDKHVNVNCRKRPKKVSVMSKKK